MAWSIIRKIEEHEGFIDPDTAIAITGWSRSTVYRMLRDQRIPNFKAGKLRQIDPHTWSYQLQRQEPMLRAAARARA